MQYRLCTAATAYCHHPRAFRPGDCLGRRSRFGARTFSAAKKSSSRRRSRTCTSESCACTASSLNRRSCFASAWSSTFLISRAPSRLYRSSQFSGGTTNCRLPATEASSRTPGMKKSSQASVGSTRSLSDSRSSPTSVSKYTARRSICATLSRRSRAPLATKVRSPASSTVKAVMWSSVTPARKGLEEVEKSS